MRVVSLVPAATEIACALGAEAQLVAVTHDCDYPPAVRTLPRVTRSTIPVGSTSRQIDTLVRTSASEGDSTFHLDADALRAARPDLILGQTLCEVCAVTLSQVPASLDSEPAVVPVDGGSLDGIFADIERVAAALGRPGAGAELIGDLRGRLTRVRSRVGGRPRPRVVCLEWLDPLFNAGHWVPEQVAIAGGDDALGAPGERSREVAWDDVRATDPEVLVCMPCGFDAARGASDAARLRSEAGWSELRAVRSGRAFAVDGNAYFSRPGPRVVDGVELLASLLHPGAVAVPPSRVIRIV